MTTGLRDLKLKDLIYGVVVPLIIGLIIIAFPLSESTLSQVNPALVGILVFGIAEMIMTVAAPIVFGLLWNRWAGGAAGFLLGSIFALWYAIYGISTPGWTNDVSLLGYLVSAMMIGYMAGALNNRSREFSRLLFSGFTSALVGALFLFLAFQFSPLQLATGLTAFFITVVSRITIGIIVPVLAKVSLRFQTHCNTSLSNLRTLLSYNLLVHQEILGSLSCISSLRLVGEQV